MNDLIEYLKETFTRFDQKLDKTSEDLAVVKASVDDLKPRVRKMELKNAASGATGGAVIYGLIELFKRLS